VDGTPVEIIEDAAQAHGSRYKSERRLTAYRPGTDTFAATFSFYATKNMTTAGEGGAVVTNSDAVAAKILLLREHGSVAKYHHEMAGHNWRITEVQAAIGRVQLQRLPDFQRARWGNAMQYNDRFTDVDLVRPSIYLGQTVHGMHHYVIQTAKRFDVIEALIANQIGYGIYYPRPANEQPYIGGRKGTFTIADINSQYNLAIPVGPWMTEDTINGVADVVIGAVR
jgi:perosamine synthetase